MIGKKTIFNPEGGNVLFLILIAVALFAALSYAVTKSTSGGVGNARGEKLSLEVSRLFGFMSDMQGRLTRMLIMGQATVPDIYINTNGASYTYMNGTSKYCCLGNPANPALYLFHPSGGGVIPQKFESLAGDCPLCSMPGATTSPGHLSFIWTNSPGLGTTATDFTVWVTGISQAACETINQKLGVTRIAFLAFTQSGFTHGTGPPAHIGPTGSAADIAAVSGKHNFCFRSNDGTNRYIYHHVLKEA